MKKDKKKKKEPKRKINARTQQIIFKTKHKKQFIQLCFASKNLYNCAMYLCRQNYFANKDSGDVLKAFLFRNELIQLLKDSQQYKELPAQTAQQTITKVDKAWKSYRKSIKAYYKDKSKFNSIPKIPKYLKKDGLFITQYPGQNLSFKDGFIRWPKTNIKIKCSELITKENIRCVRIVPFCNIFKVEIVYEKIYQKIDLDYNKIIGIDIGINNLMAIASNQNDIPTFLVNGRPLKSVNQFYNKQLAKRKSILKIVNDKHYSKYLHRLTYKRGQKINDYLHKASRFIINLCKELQIGTIVIGKNDNWKQNSKLSKRVNQSFVQIPTSRLIDMIKYKAQQFGIIVICHEESYTSKVDHLALEEMKFQKQYKGKRTNRGLFKSSIGKVLNADINGAIGIIRKVAGDSFIQEIVSRGFVYDPFKICLV